MAAMGRFLVRYGFCMGRGLDGFFVVSLYNDDLKFVVRWVGVWSGRGVVVSAGVGRGFGFGLWLCGASRQHSY